MADIQPNKKTSQENSAGTLVGTDLIRLTQGTGTDDNPYVSVKASLNFLAAYFGTGGGGGGGIESIVAGSGITVDATDPLNPIVSAAGAASPVPAGCFAWYSIMQTSRLPSAPIYVMTSPSSGAGIGSLGSTVTAAVFDVNGEVPSGTVLNTNITPVCANITVMAVVRTPALSSGTLSTILGGPTGSLELRMHGTSTGWYIELIKCAVVLYGDESGIGSVMAPNTLSLVTATLAAGTWTIRRNGVQTVTGTPSQMPTGVTNQLGTSGAGEGNIHALREVLFFDHVLSGSDMIAAETYLKTRHGI